MHIQWTNKYSGEVGFVKSVSKVKRCFINTFSVDEAKTYKTPTAAAKDLEILHEIGEDENNDFKIV